MAAEPEAQPLESNQRQSPLDRDQIDKFGQAIRDLIRHENELVNHRISWLVQIQGLSFAALGFAWDKNPYLPYILVFLGIATAFSAWSAMALNTLAIDRLETLWSSSVSANLRATRPVIGFSQQSAAKTAWRNPLTWLLRWPWLRPWNALPFIFFAAWIAVFAVKLFACGQTLEPNLPQERGGASPLVPKPFYLRAAPNRPI